MNSFQAIPESFSQQTVFITTGLFLLSSILLTYWHIVASIVVVDYATFLLTEKLPPSQALGKAFSKCQDTRTWDKLLRTYNKFEVSDDSFF
jgi:hypothetical protein